MCGICGIIDYNQKIRIDENVLGRMCSSIRHRGPDDEGIYFNSQARPQIGLGHRRLKVIDLSKDAYQPMTNEDETLRIVFNGEIYNYKELRAELENKGHVFKSHSDTESIIHLYEEYGEACVQYLRGMFAFALWNDKKKALMLARDRVGKKPLLYYHKENMFCFASEFSSLLENSSISKEMDFLALDYYFTFGYIPAPLTIYKNIFKLPPAHILILKDNNSIIKKYWELDYDNKINISEVDAAKEVLRLLKEAVRIRLYSDVPLGAFLSGGIDSSTVVGLMSQLSTNKVKTFTIGFSEKDFSELKYARNIAHRFDTEHHEFIVEPKALEILPLLVERYGEPYADSSCIPTFYVSQQTRRFVTVALNGDGGDENFAGYERYQAMLIAEILQKMPSFFKLSLKNITRILPDSINPKNTLRRIKRFIDGAYLSSVDRYAKWVGVFDEDLKRELYNDEFASIVSKNNKGNPLSAFINISNSSDLLDSLLKIDVNSYLPNDLLVKVDIASMANSLETRSPFLDHKLMEFTARLPSTYKMKWFIKKYILKKAIKDLVPEENTYRRKMGFGIPIGEWFRGPLKGFLYETLQYNSIFAKRYLRAAVIKEMLEKHISRRKDYAFQLWSLLMLELWYKRFIEAK